jgi:uncharacterized membrane protein
MNSDKNLELDRLVFFSDAVVAIAITLLVFNLKITKTDNDHLTFADLANAWKIFIAFFLSFFIIAIFWKIHHEFYVHIRKISNTLLWLNIGWLLFIVTLPFTTTLVSAHLHDTAAVVSYCINVLMVTIFQNLIWDYVAARPDFLKENVDSEIIRNYAIGCNVAMVNAVLATVISIFYPIAAMVILFTRLPLFGFASSFYKKKVPKKTINPKDTNQG